MTLKTAYTLGLRHNRMDEAVKGMTIRSAQMGVELKFGFWFQNNTAIEGVSAEIKPEDFSPQMKKYWEELGTEVRPFEASSPIFVVDEDFSVWHVPNKSAKTPVLVMLPDFRSLAHSLNNGLVSAGLAWGVFRFTRCEAKLRGDTRPAGALSRGLQRLKSRTGPSLIGFGPPS